MSNWAIVAIPDEDDYVWKISSEKVPHVTLLFLGDQTDNQNEVKTAGFLEHVVDISHRFMLEVDHRGTLGPKDADVLFMAKNSQYRQLAETRANLLRNPEILRMYLGAEQFPNWEPHLTLGFPETPAKPDNRDYPNLHWINFNRLALWTEDYSGYEFILPNYGEMEVLSMSDKTEDFLSHYGVLGMHWGRRKDKVGKVKVAAKSEGRTKPSEDAVKAKTFEKTAKTNGTASLTNAELQQLVTRKNLEQQYNRLSPNTVKKGNDHVKEVLAIAGTATAGYALYKSPLGQIAEQAIKRKLKIKPKNALF